jgi:phosphoglucosamine mutase
MMERSSHMGKLFGTDGIRGKANQYPINVETALKIGQSLARYFSHRNRKKAVIVGKDPRLSGDMLAHAVMAGICSMGMDVIYTGTLPTPAIAFLTRNEDAAAGVMVSASHNPYFDNGIKVFDENGFKLSQVVENEIESLILKDEHSPCRTMDNEMGKVKICPNPEEKYTSFLCQALPPGFSLKGLKIILDCANGATFKVAPELFRKLGAMVSPLFVKPNGVNINDHCGSQHPETMIKTVLGQKADLGLAFDGDGDRLIAVDEKGQRISGDQILAICGKMLKNQGRLANDIIIATVMSNLGLRIALEQLGINLIMTDVGDRNVLEQMLKNNSVLGGEDSGHMIFLQNHVTGDGILTALKLIEAIKFEQKPLSKLADIMKVFPQVLVNVPVKKQSDLNEDGDIRKVISGVEEKLGNRGRVLVRYSGTRPLCRVMVEGPTEAETNSMAHEIAGVVAAKLG